MSSFLYIDRSTWLDVLEIHLHHQASARKTRPSHRSQRYTAVYIPVPASAPPRVRGMQNKAPLALGRSCCSQAEQIFPSSLVNTATTRDALIMQLLLEQSRTLAPSRHAYSLYLHPRRKNDTIESRSSHGSIRIPTSPCVCLRGLFPMVFQMQTDPFFLYVNTMMQLFPEP
jgi:hypothetical protein